jgi:hypothetical protein
MAGAWSGQVFADQAVGVAPATGRHRFVPRPRTGRQWFDVKEIDDPKSVQWASFIPPTAKVKAKMNATFNADGQLVAAPEKVALGRRF